MFRRPVVVLGGGAELLRTAHCRALDRDRDNRAAVAAVPGDALDLVGLAVHGPRNAVDTALKGARMHAG